MDEQLQDCVYCGNTPPPKGFFCPNCAKQIRCKNCKENLEKDAIACIYCGIEVTSEIPTNEFSYQPGLNTIEYHETRSSRSFKASVSDNVGNSLSSVLGAFVGKGFTPRQVKSKYENEPLIEDGIAEVFNEEKTSSEKPILAIEIVQPEQPENSFLNAQLKKIFRFDEDKTVLLEPRLKAQNRTDYARRLILLFLKANQLLLGKSQVQRSEVIKILEKAKTGLNDGNTRRWISNNTALTIDEKAHTLEIITEGEELVQTYLQEMENPEIKDIWLNTSPVKKRKKHESENSIEK